MQTRFSIPRKRKKFRINLAGSYVPQKSEWNSFSVSPTERDFEKKEFLHRITEHYQKQMQQNGLAGR